MTDPRLAPDAHAGHDLLLIAALAADDLGARERAAAERQVADCHACADLRRDLYVIAQATAALPEPRRPRDFTITAEEAARQRRPSLRRFLVGLAGPQGFIGRPLAATVTSLGVAGIIVASAGGFLQGGAAAGARPEFSVNVDAGRPVPTEPADPAAAPQFDTGTPKVTTGTPGTDTSGAEPGSSYDPRAYVRGEGNQSGAPTGVPGAGAVSSEDPVRGTSLGERLTNAAQTPALVVVSLGFLGLGLLLFALRRIAGRLT